MQNREVEQLRQGVKIEEYTTKPAKVKILKTDTHSNYKSNGNNIVPTAFLPCRVSEYTPHLEA